MIKFKPIKKKVCQNVFSNDLNTSYAYECERRKDEMREAAQSNLLRELPATAKVHPAWWQP
jgi:hypothetical protein